MPDSTANVDEVMTVFFRIVNNTGDMIILVRSFDV